MINFILHNLFKFWEIKNNVFIINLKKIKIMTFITEILIIMKTITKNKITKITINN